MSLCFLIFFLNDPATTEISPLPLHAALPIFSLPFAPHPRVWGAQADAVNTAVARLARTIARYQPVSVLCRPAQRKLAQDRCGRDNIEIGRASCRERV